MTSCRRCPSFRHCRHAAHCARPATKHWSRRKAPHHPRRRQLRPQPTTRRSPAPQFLQLQCLQTQCLQMQCPQMQCPQMQCPQLQCPLSPFLPWPLRQRHLPRNRSRRQSCPTSSRPRPCRPHRFPQRQRRGASRAIRHPHRPSQSSRSRSRSHSPSNMLRRSSRRSLNQRPPRLRLDPPLLKPLRPHRARRLL
jgi:hypothetical protein